MSVAGEPAYEAPVLSADRALSHFLTGVDIDLASLDTFYGNLPHEDKPALSDLQIHLSATPFISDYDVTTGELAWGGSKSVTTPELPKSDKPLIIVYIGSTLLRPDNKKSDLEDGNLNEELSAILKHELTHYAQGRSEKPGLTRAQKIKNSASIAGFTALIGIVEDRLWLKAATAAFVASEILSKNNSEGSLKIAGGTGLLVHIMGRKARREDMFYRDHERYLNREDEINANVHSNGSDKLVQTSIAEIDKRKLKTIRVNETRNRMFRWAANAVHKKLASQPANL